MLSLNVNGLFFCEHIQLKQMMLAFSQSRSLKQFQNFEQSGLFAHFERVRCFCIFEGSGHKRWMFDTLTSAERLVFGVFI